MRRGTDEDEQRLHVHLAGLAGRGVAHDDRLERFVALQLHDLAAREHLDLLAALDLVDEIARHRLAEVLAADHQAAAHRVLR